MIIDDQTTGQYVEKIIKLNPAIIPKEDTLILQKNGVQIFIATHSYNFAKYLEIRKSRNEQVLFHNLYKGTSDIPDTMKSVFPQENNRKDEVYSISAYKMEDLGPNHIIMADNRLLDEVYNM